MPKTRSKRKIINKNKKKKKSLKYKGGAAAAGAAPRRAFGPVVPCCQGGFSQIKFVRVHGCSTRGIRNVKTGEEYDPIIEIPENTNVITLTEPGDVLSVASSIKDVIFNSYLQGNTLYPIMHGERKHELTESGKFIEDTFNNMNEPQNLKEGEQPKQKIKFKNHLPGEGINNIFMDFNDPACGSDAQITLSCKIFCLDKIGPYPNTGKGNNRNTNSQGCSPKPEIKPMEAAEGRQGRNRANSPEAQEMNYEGDLEGLLHREGAGTYILSICRGYQGPNAAAVKQEMKTFSEDEN